MQININKLADYYANANLLFVDAFEDRVQPGSVYADGKTSTGVCGIVIPLEGSARFTLNGTPYLLEPGVVVHAGSGMRLDKEVIGNKIWHYVLLHYRVIEHEQVPFAFLETNFHIAVGANPRLVDMAQQLIISESTPGSMAVLRSKSLFHNIMEEIILSGKRQYRDNNGEMIEEIITHIHENYSQQLSVAHLAKQYGLSSKRFGELFQMHIGITPIRYLTELRIKRAKELLRTCDCSVKQVAEYVGYSDNLYFSKVFKKQTGFSPSEFRDSIKNCL